MMTTDHPPTTTPPSVTPPTPGDRAGETAGIVFFGTVAWLGFVWLGASIIYGFVVAGVARWGTVDQSLWTSVAASWQRYLVFAAGVTVATTFLRMLVRNGATRRLLSIGATVTMAALGVLLALWNVTGLSIEKLVFDANDWPQVLRSDAVFAWNDLVRAAVDNGFTIAAYYGAGWIVGICYLRWGAVGGTVRFLPAVLPAAAMEFLVSSDFGGMNIDVVDDWRDGPHVALTVIGGGALLVATVAVARRLTRDAALK